MWFFLAFAAVCFTIIVLFRMFIDMRRMEQQHNRLMQSDRREYERFIEVATRELPKAALPDFSKAIVPRPIPTHEIRYRRDGELPSANQLSEVQRIYMEQEMSRFIDREERRDRMNRNW